MSSKPLHAPLPTKQLAVHQMLLVYRRTVLHDALMAALSLLDPDAINSELTRVAPTKARKVLAGAGIRDEEVFVVPTLLRAEPRLLGYYRLVLGVPQKQMYRSDTGIGPFQAMETKGVVPKRVEDRLDELCIALNGSLGALVEQLAPPMTRQDLAQLPLLVLGVQIDGRLRNEIGTVATDGVFEALIHAIESTSGSIIERSSDGRQVTFLNNSGRQVSVKLASDPDVVIEEVIGSEIHFKVAIEIKGGTDQSNAHNRAGEAEKSHQKVSSEAGDFWTVIALKGLDQRLIESESPTTKHWFDISEILARSGPSWERFRARVIVACGV